MIRLILRGLITPCLAAMAYSPAPAADSGPPRKVASVEGITEYMLDNGTRFLLFPDPSTPKVTVNMTVLVGSRHEGYGETGMAHLLEHMVFKGTPRNPDIDDAMKGRGASFNGSTDPDRTNYYETLPAGDDNLEYAIALEADRLVNSYVRDEDLRTEFSVVRNEFERGENSAERVLNQRMMSVAYEWHNYGKSTIGNRTDIERVPIDRLKAFYKKYYQPDNIVVVVAGKFEEAKALELMRKHFGAIPKPDRKLDATYTEEPPQDGERLVTLRRVGDTPVVGLAYHVPAVTHPDAIPVQVLGSILSTQPSGRLYKALVEPKKAASVFASGRPSHDPGLFEVTASLPKGGSLDEARDIILATLEGVKEKGVTQDEVDPGQAADPQGPRAGLGRRQPDRRPARRRDRQGDWRFYFINRDRVEAVTPEQVQQVAKKYLTRSNRTVGYFIPTDQPERTPVPEGPSIASLVDGYKGREAGSAGEAFDASPLAIEKRVQRPQAIEGVKVALLPKKTRGETVNLALTLHYGNAENLKGYNAASGFLGDLMTRGTKKMNRQQIQDALDANTARLSAGMGGGGRGGRGGGGGGGALGSVTFSVETKRANLPAVLEILRQVLREPTLPADEFDVMKVARISALESSRTDPAALSAGQLSRMLSSYPKDDVRYLPTPDESLERMKAATIDQVRTLYDEYLGAGHGELAIVGDFEPSEALPIVAKMLEGWKASRPYGRIERPYQGNAQAARETIVTPDKANANYVAGMELPIGDDHPDYPALIVGNFVLGGGSLSSRLGDRLRQKDGLSYGAGSAFAASAFEPRATLLLNAICNPGNLPRVVAGADEELARLLKDGITAQELALAKTGYARQQELRRSNDGALAGLLSGHLERGRTLKHDADLEASIQGLNADDVAKALRKHIDPRKLVVVGAGDVPAGSVK
ncbi:MAG: pitrilysin family protein [Isosphaeraceae bacterium]